LQFDRKIDLLWYLLQCWAHFRCLRCGSAAAVAAAGVCRCDERRYTIIQPSSASWRQLQQQRRGGGVVGGPSVSRCPLGYSTITSMSAGDGAAHNKCVIIHTNIHTYYLSYTEFAHAVRELRSKFSFAQFGK